MIGTYFDDGTGEHGFHGGYRNPTQPNVPLGDVEDTLAVFDRLANAPQMGAGHRASLRPFLFKACVELLVEKQRYGDVVQGFAGGADPIKMEMFMLDFFDSKEKAEGREDILVVVGGVVPPGDYDELRAAGAAAIFGPGTVISKAALEILELLEINLGLTGDGIGT